MSAVSPVFVHVVESPVKDDETLRSYFDNRDNPGLQWTGFILLVSSGFELLACDWWEAVMVERRTFLVGDRVVFNTDTPTYPVHCKKGQAGTVRRVSYNHVQPHCDVSFDYGRLWSVHPKELDLEAPEDRRVVLPMQPMIEPTKGMIQTAQTVGWGVSGDRYEATRAALRAGLNHPDARTLLQSAPSPVSAETARLRAIIAAQDAVLQAERAETKDIARRHGPEYRAANDTALSVTAEAARAALARLLAAEEPERTSPHD